MIFLDTLNIALGETGSGKSNFGMAVVEHFLMIDDPRPIVTTLSIQMPEFADYLQNKYGDRAPSNLASKVLRIYEHDLRKYWRIRGIQYDGDYGYGPRRVGEFGGPDWQIAMQGVIYVLDEAYVAFQAREFMKNGGEFLRYLPQARKIDITVAISPASSLLDKAFRDMANQCIVLTNFYKIRVKGFTAQRKLGLRVFKNCPPVRGEECLQEMSLYIDAKGLSRCYKSEEGLGVIGTTADKGRVAKGIPWWMIIPIGIGAGLLIWLVITQGMHATTRWGLKKLAISDKHNQAAAAAAFTAVAPSSAPSPFAGLAASNVTRFVPPKPEQPQPPRKAQARGFAVLNGILYIDTRLGQVRASTWTNAGDAIFANGVEWSLPPETGAPRRF